MNKTHIYGVLLGMLLTGPIWSANEATVDRTAGLGSTATVTRNGGTLTGT